jgi:hypothetical protein
MYSKKVSTVVVAIVFVLACISSLMIADSFNPGGDVGARLVFLVFSGIMALKFIADLRSNEKRPASYFDVLSWVFVVGVVIVSIIVGAFYLVFESTIAIKTGVIVVISVSTILTLTASRVWDSSVFAFGDIPCALGLYVVLVCMVVGLQVLVTTMEMGKLLVILALLSLSPFVLPLTFFGSLQLPKRVW